MQTDFSHIGSHPLPPAELHRRPFRARLAGSSVLTAAVWPLRAFHPYRSRLAFGTCLAGVVDRTRRQKRRLSTVNQPAGVTPVNPCPVGPESSGRVRGFRVHPAGSAGTVKTPSRGGRAASRGEHDFGARCFVRRFVDRPKPPSSIWRTAGSHIKVTNYLTDGVSKRKVHPGRTVGRMVEIKTVKAQYVEPDFQRIKALKPDDMTWPEAIEHAFEETWGDGETDDEQ